MDDVNMEFSLHFTFREEWVDERLLFNSPALSHIVLSPGQKIWVPDTFFQVSPTRLGCVSERKGREEARHRHAQHPHPSVQRDGKDPLLVQVREGPGRRPPLPCLIAYRHSPPL